MDELSRAARALVLDPPATPPSLDDLDRRNGRRRNRRRAVAGAVLVVLVAAGSLVVIARRSTPEHPVVTVPGATSGVLAVATAHGVTLVDEGKGVVAEVDLGFAPISLSWSPNGRWLAASGEHDAVVLGRDGEERHRVPEPFGDLGWVREQTLVLDGDVEMEPGGEARRLGENGGFRSPDGRLLARTNAPARSITISAPDGSKARTYGPLPEVEAGIISDGFSPDGRWIVYSAFPVQSASIAADGVPLYALRVADGFTLRIGVTLGYADWIRWSPDGETLLVVAGEGRFLTDRKVLRRCNLDARSCDDLVAPSGLSSYDPAWSPDGRRIAFIGLSTSSPVATDPVGDLWVCSGDCRDAAPVRNAAGPAVGAFWSAGGDAIVEIVPVDIRKGAFAVARVPMTGGPATALGTVLVPAVTLAMRVHPPVVWSPSSR